jgi:hypothetical protein
MSTAAATYLLSGGQIQAEASDEVRVIYSYGETMARTESLRYRPVQRASTTGHAGQKSTFRVLRRLKGFLVEMQGVDARVAFIENGQTIPYDLPAAQLRHAGITAKNQPFQMDEVEMRAGDEGSFIGYRFLPLAKTSDAYIETLNLDDERKRKRDLIFKEFAKSQD